MLPSLARRTSGRSTRRCNPGDHRVLPNHMDAHASSDTFSKSIRTFLPLQGTRRLAISRPYLHTRRMHTRRMVTMEAQEFQAPEPAASPRIVQRLRTEAHHPALHHRRGPATRAYLQPHPNPRGRAIQVFLLTLGLVVQLMMMIAAVGRLRP